MSQGRRFSIYLTDDQVRIADAIATRQEMSRSEVIQHLVIYQGLCGGDFPLTRKILNQRPTDRDRLIREIRERNESNNPPKPQAFREWVKETLGSADKESMEKGSESLLERLLSDSPLAAA